MPSSSKYLDERNASSESERNEVLTLYLEPMHRHSDPVISNNNFYSLRMNSPRYCREKVIYDKRGAITAKNRRFEEDKVALRIYHCPFCNGWHLTSQNPYFGEKRYSKNHKRNKPYKRRKFIPFNPLISDQENSTM